MSYARFGENGSDVYVYGHVCGGYECCGCSMGEKWHFDTLEELLSHLEKHIKKGDRVPKRALDRIHEEMEMEKNENKE